jgi:hypothetical protein
MSCRDAPAWCERCNNACMSSGLIQAAACSMESPGRPAGGPQEFARLRNLAGGLNGLMDEPYARALLSVEPVAFVLEQARDRSAIYADYLRQEQGFDAEHLAFLDRGARGFPRWLARLPNSPIASGKPPTRLKWCPWEASRRLASSGATVGFAAYPERGVLPAIDDSGLDFLHADIQRACLCVGSVVEGRMRARWLGRQALVNGELWSCTKIIPLLQVVAHSNSRFPGADLGWGPGPPPGEGWWLGMASTLWRWMCSATSNDDRKFQRDRGDVQTVLHPEQSWSNG